MQAMLAAADDAPALAAIHALAFPPVEAWGPAAFNDFLASPGCFALWFPHEALLLLRFVADQSEILTLATSPASRRRGLARALLGQGLEACRLNRIKSQFLEVSTKNEAALRLYETLGFVEIARRSKYYPDLSDAIILRFNPCAE